MKETFEFSLPLEEFRSQPVPVQGLDRKAIVLSDCFVDVNSLPVELQEWLEVNPRIPKFTTKNKLAGSVAKGIVKTLQEEPDRFALKNQGIYISVDSAIHQKQPGGNGLLTLILTDKKRHGVINGGHTLRAILEARDSISFASAAYVRLHIYQLKDEVDIDMIADMAEGLNRSLQVDDPSLENLKGSFDQIKEVLKGKRGAEQIAYHQGHPGNVDVIEVLTLCSLFNIKKYSDRSKHPHALFGHRKEVLDTFVDDINISDSAFKRILPKLHEILAFSERVQQVLAPELGKIKKSNRQKDNRIGSEPNKREGYFISGELAELPLGFTYPLVAAFRANVCPEAWKKGQFEWLEDPESLLKKYGKELATVVKQEYIDNKGKPAEVGRKEAAYRSCYNTITIALIEVERGRQRQAG
ncbi:AIPR family protein [Microcoleus sp. Pol11C2]|uniref:AIPR family protein n=1 Tax=Microcoleus sp. Pol11C2 TaxID=3055389 RepID=UPI002FD5EE38